MGNRDDAALADLARRRVSRYHFWGTVNWWAYKWFAGISLAAALVVPFGLGALLYVSPDHRRQLNLWLLGVSALALLAQVVGFHLRLGQCGRAMFAAEQSLENALAKHEDGLIDADQLAEALDRSSGTALSQEGP